MTSGVNVNVQIQSKKKGSTGRTTKNNKIIIIKEIKSLPRKQRTPTDARVKGKFSSRPRRRSEKDPADESNGKFRQTARLDPNNWSG